jgi:UDP-glucuronate 4-epimerase
MKKLIVTGSEGFIGKALVVYLQERGYEVIGIDRKNGIEVADYFADPKNLENVDAVFHLAAQTSVFNKNIEQIRRDNIDTFITVCDACRDAGVRLVYASSSTANPYNTTSMYGISKHFDEQYAQCYNPNAIGVRLHNVYGPNPRQGTLLWYLLTQDKVQLVNLGGNIRHFTYIGDVCDGLFQAYLMEETKLVNIANPLALSTFDFARCVWKHKTLDIELVDKRVEFDNMAQSVDDKIYTLPLQYTSADVGVHLSMLQTPYVKDKMRIPVYAVKTERTSR